MPTLTLARSIRSEWRRSLLRRVPLPPEWDGGDPDSLRFAWDVLVPLESSLPVQWRVLRFALTSDLLLTWDITSGVAPALPLSWRIVPPDLIAIFGLTREGLS